MATDPVGGSLSVSGEPIRERDIALLRKTLSMLCHFVWHKTTRPGEHMWSIPVDRERDFDCILSDAIDELERRRLADLPLPLPPSLPTERTTTREEDGKRKRRR